MDDLRAWQKKIYGTAKAVGIADDEDLHALVSYACGKASLKEITKQDYILIMKEIRSRFPAELVPKPDVKSRTRAVSGMTEGQIRKVYQLMHELVKYDSVPSTATLRERLCGIIKRELKIDAQPKEPFVWLTYKNGSTLIERIKKYVENAEKRQLRGG